jgi:hypothetical protein
MKNKQNHNKIMRSSSHKNLFNLYVIKNQVFYLLFMSY